MGKCIECGKEGDWLTICPYCFASAMIDIDEEQTKSELRRFDNMIDLLIIVIVGGYIHYKIWTW